MTQFLNSMLLDLIQSVFTWTHHGGFPLNLIDRSCFNHVLAYRNGKALLLIWMFSMLAQGVVQGGQAIRCGDLSIPLTREMIIDRALCSHPDIRIQAAVRRQYAADVDASIARQRPTVQASGQWSRRDTDIAGFDTDTSETWDARLDLAYLLWDFGEQHAQVEQSRWLLMAQNHYFDTTVAQVVSEVLLSYYDALQALENLEVSRMRLNRHYMLSRITHERHRVGEDSALEPAQADSALAQSKLEWSRAENQWRQSQANLNERLGLSANESLNLAPQEWNANDLEPLSDLSAWMAQALRQRPELAEAKARVEAARSNYEARRRAPWPELSFTSGWGYTDSGRDDPYRNWRAGLNIEIPMYAGGRYRAERQKAEASLSEQKSRYLRWEQVISAEVWRAYFAWRTAWDELSPSEDWLSSARHTYRISLGRYEAGEGELRDVLDAQLVLFEAERNQTVIHYDWRREKDALAMAIGALPSISEKPKP